MGGLGQGYGPAVGVGLSDPHLISSLCFLCSLTQYKPKERKHLVGWGWGSAHLLLAGEGPQELQEMMADLYQGWREGTG